MAVTNLLEITGGDPEFLAEMIESYLETPLPLLAQLHESLAASDTALTAVPINASYLPS